MMWNNDWSGWGWGAWCLMGFSMILIIGLVIWGVAALIGTNNNGIANPESPQDTLAARLARGEISEDDFRRQRELIKHPN